VRLVWRSGEFGQWLGGRNLLCVACLPWTRDQGNDWAAVSVMGSQVRTCALQSRVMDRRIPSPGRPMIASEPGLPHFHTCISRQVKI
jgi:hypothetical protein